MIAQHDPDLLLKLDRLTHSFLAERYGGRLSTMRHMEFRQIFHHIRRSRLGMWPVQAIIRNPEFREKR